MESLKEGSEDPWTPRKVTLNNKIVHMFAERKLENKDPLIDWKMNEIRPWFVQFAVGDYELQGHTKKLDLRLFEASYYEVEQVKEEGEDTSDIEDLELYEPPEPQQPEPE